MNNSRKRKKTLIRRETREEDGILYRYELKIHENEHFSYAPPQYSISIEMILPDGSTTYREMSEIFLDAGKAILYFDRLVKNLATPIDLPYIVEDDLYS